MLWHKAWVETRWRFWIGAAILLCTASFVVFSWPRVAAGLPLSVANEGADTELARKIREGLAINREYRGYVWDQLFRNNLTNLGILFAALLGAGGLLSARAGSLFLLSMPASRTRLLLTRAFTGLSELLALVLMSALAVSVLSPAVGKSYALGDALAHGICLFFGVAVFYSLSFLLSTEFADVWRPLLIAIAVAVVIGLIEQTLDNRAYYGLFRLISGEPYFRAGRIPWTGLLAIASASAGMLYAAVVNTARRDF